MDLNQGEINWQKLWVKENKEKYRDLTKELIEKDDQEESATDSVSIS